MALTSKASSSPILPDWTASPRAPGISRSVPNSPQHCLQTTYIHGNDHGKQSRWHHEAARLSISRNVSWNLCRRPVGYIIDRGSSIFCRSMRTQRTGSTEDVRHTGDCSNASREIDEADDIRTVFSQDTVDTTYGIAGACKFVYNDAKFVNERARSDIVILSRGILSLDARARQDVAILGSKFLKLDARAREDTEKIIDLSVKKKAERLNRIAKILKETAGSRLKKAADRHWSDGALEADLRRADYHAKRRAMEDTCMALEFVKDIHDIMVNKMYDFPLRQKDGQDSSNLGLEKNGRSFAQFPGEVSSDRIHALEEAYWSMASALSEADGIDYTDPDELELLVATLIDLDAMDGKSSVSLLAECSSSPDVNTRQALANALATAPSMWTLGNAGMGALQRLAEDSDPAVAAAASKAINELKKQWEIEEGDNWRFTLDPNTIKGSDELDNDCDDEED